MAQPETFAEHSDPQWAGLQVGEVLAFPSWRRARDKACAALLAGERFLLVTGPAGTGKTLLIQEIAKILRFTGWEVETWIAGVSAEAARPAPAATSALLVDEADRLSGAELRALRSSARSSVLLTGLDSLADRCPGSPRISIGLLSPSEARTFIELWLAQVGVDASRLEEAAVLQIIERSRGVPRLLNALLGGSLWLAGAGRVSPRRVEEAASLRDCLLDRDEQAGADPGDDEEELPAAALPGRSGRRVRRLLLAGAALGAVAGAGVGAARYWPRQVDWRGMVASYLPHAGIAAAPSVPTAAAQAAVPAADAKPNRVEEVRFTDPQSRPAGVEPAPSVAAPAAASPSPDPSPAAQPSPPPEFAAPATPNAEPVVPPPASAAPPSGPNPDALSPALVEILVRRGNEMFALGDYSAARLLFGRAAAAGNAAAMLAMGHTYDPAFLDSTASPGATDPAAAAQWYRLALAAGNSEAGGLLQRVERQVAR